MEQYPYSFQVDSQIVGEAYAILDNYLIIEEHGCQKNQSTPKCILYFSGHSIYYPNNETSFNETIIKKNRFEWYRSRLKGASKHIFLRDIHKQWYLSGINKNINTPEALLKFLKKETNGYDIICIGSSAGGYAAFLYGSLLNAKIVYAFSAQTELDSLLSSSTPEIDPLVFRLRNTKYIKYYDITSYISQNHSTSYYYFVPINNSGDKKAMKHLQAEICNQKKVEGNMNIVRFYTSKHGIPFPKVALSKILTYDPAFISNYINKVNNPLFFSIKMVGLWSTLKGVYIQFKNFIKNKS